MNEDLDNMLNKLHVNSDSQADNEKRAASYLMDFIGGSRDVFFGIFEKSKFEKSALPKEVFNFTVDLINEISDDYILGSVKTRHFKRGSAPYDASVEVGLRNFNVLSGFEEDQPGESIPHILLPSKKGFEIIDGYRSILGKSSLQESKHEAIKQMTLTE